jgi:hypothetical protein
MNKTILKRAGLIVASAALVLTPLVGLASSEWGPAREIKAYTPGIAGFDHPQFNSFTGTPSYGDERTFFDGRDSKITGDGNFEDNIDVTNSDEVMLRIYGHNNADPSTNGANNDGVGVAKGTKVRVQLPTDAARSLRANAFISASNAKPGEVFDSADFQTSGAGAFKLSYVPGSASI